MAKHFQKPFIAKMLNEGQNVDIHLIQKDIVDKARLIASKMPTNPIDRQVFVRNIVEQSIKGEIDKDVFKELIRQTNTYVIVGDCLPRLRLLNK
jgi:hypothetical protein